VLGITKRGIVTVEAEISDPVRDLARQDYSKASFLDILTARNGFDQYRSVNDPALYAADDSRSLAEFDRLLDLKAPPLTSGWSFDASSIFGPSVGQLMSALPRTGGQSLSQGAAPGFFQNYRNAVLGRQSIAGAQWDSGGLGYVSAPLTYAFSAAMGASDLASSYYRGRGGVVSDSDRQTSDITGFALGGVQNMASKLGRLPVTRPMGGTFDLGINGPQHVFRAPTIARFEGATGTVNTRAFVEHGNSALSPRTAYLYELYMKDGTFLKNGVTQNLDTRYTNMFMANKDIFRIAEGSRADMLAFERQRTIANPGPMNNEAWAKAARARLGR
jgi:hypothetical protein